MPVQMDTQATGIITKDNLVSARSRGSIIVATKIEKSGDQ
jgi:signal-transduction protein with cAMP-binding, CBS, and nucleotidyltransferase domain